MKNDRTENFGLLLHDTARLLRKQFEARGREMGLSSAQWRLLVRLWREGEATQARLADLMEVEPISVSRLVDRMVVAGWIERRPHPTDRRTNLIVPTARALRARDAIKEMAGEIYEAAMTGLTTQDRRQLMAMLTQVEANLSRTENEHSGADPVNEDAR